MSFTYTFTIHKASPILRETAIADAIPSCAEIVFISKPFGDYAECFSEVALLFNKLGSMLSSPQPPAIILHKLNPAINKDADGTLHGITWDSSTVCRLFLANSDDLKKNVLTFNVAAEIRYDGNIADLIEMFTEEEETADAE